MNDGVNSQPAVKWVRKKPLANHLGVSESTINKLMKSRAIPFVRRKRLILFDLEAVERALRTYEVNPVMQKTNPR